VAAPLPWYTPSQAATLLAATARLQYRVPAADAHRLLCIALRGGCGEAAAELRGANGLKKGGGGLGPAAASKHSPAASAVQRSSSIGSAVNDGSPTRAADTASTSPHRMNINSSGSAVNDGSPICAADTASTSPHQMNINSSGSAADGGSPTRAADTALTSPPQMNSNSSGSVGSGNGGGSSNRDTGGVGRDARDSSGSAGGSFERGSSKFDGSAVTSNRQAASIGNGQPETGSRNEQRQQQHASQQFLQQQQQQRQQQQQHALQHFLWQQQQQQRQQQQHLSLLEVVAVARAAARAARWSLGHRKLIVRQSVSAAQLCGETVQILCGETVVWRNSCVESSCVEKQLCGETVRKGQLCGETVRRLEQADNLKAIVHCL